MTTPSDSVEDAVTWLREIANDETTNEDLAGHIRTVLERLQKDNFSLAAGQCIFPNGDGLVGDDYGHSVCLKDKRAEAAKAKVEALLKRIEDEAVRVSSFTSQPFRMGAAHIIEIIREALATINPSRDGE